VEKRTALLRGEDQGQREADREQHVARRSRRGLRSRPCEERGERDSEQQDRRGDRPARCGAAAPPDVKGADRHHQCSQHHLYFQRAPRLVASSSHHLNQAHQRERQNRRVRHNPVFLIEEESRSAVCEIGEGHRVRPAVRRRR
jgi:hypothetical protein